MRKISNIHISFDFYEDSISKTQKDRTANDVAEILLRNYSDIHNATDEERIEIQDGDRLVVGHFSRDTFYLEKYISDLSEQY